MEKKKAIKIATATAIAATAITGVVAPAQTEAASSLDKQITKAKSTMKKPYDRYIKSTSKLAALNTVKKDITAAKKAQKDANAAIKKAKLTTAQKNAKYAQIKSYAKYITRAEGYVKGYEQATAARAELAKLTATLNTEDQIATAEAAIKVAKKEIKDTVYGAKIETLLYNRFTKPAETAVAAAKKALATPVAIESVSALNDANSYLSIKFNTKVSNLEASAVEIKDAKSGETYGVKNLTLSADGKTATAELYSPDNASKDNPVLKYVRDYTVTVTANNKTVEYTFNRQAFDEKRVTAVDFDNRKITLEGLGSKEVLPSVDMDFEEVKGRTIRVWYNDKDEVTKFTFDDKEKVIYSSIQLDKDDVIKTLTDGSKYDISDKKDTFKFEVNDEEQDYVTYRKNKTESTNLKDPELDFAKVVLGSNGEVEWVSAYNFSNYSVVKSVDTAGEQIVGEVGTSSISNAADYLIIKDGKQVSYKDLKAGDVVLYQPDAYGEDGFAVVYNKTVSGKIDTVYEKSLVVGGNKYDYLRDEPYYIGNMVDAKYLDTDGEYKTASQDDIEDLQKAGEVTLHLDAKGDLLFVTGGIVDTAKNVAVLTDNVETDTAYGKYSIQLEALMADKSEKLYDIQLENLDKITYNGVELDIDDSADRNNDEYAPSFKTGVVNEKTVVTHIVLTPKVGDAVEIPVGELAKGDLVEFGFDTNGKVKELKVFKNGITANTDEDEAFDWINTTETGANTDDKQLESGDLYAVTEAGSKLLKDDTIVFDATKGDTYSYDPEDITVSTWKDYKGSDIEIAKVLFDDDNEVVAIGIESKVSNDSVEEEAVITDLARNTDGDLVSIEAYVMGKKQTIAVDKLGTTDADNLVKGDVAVLTFDKGNLTLVQDISRNPANRTLTNYEVVSVDTGKREVTFTTNGTDRVTYKLATDGLILDGRNNDGITIEAFADLEKQTNVTIVKDEKTGTFAKYFMFEAKDASLLNPEAPVDPVDPATPSAPTVTATSDFLSDDVINGSEISSATTTTFKVAFAAGEDDLAAGNAVTVSINNVALPAQTLTVADILNGYVTVTADVSAYNDNTYNVTAKLANTAGTSDASTAYAFKIDTAAATVTTKLAAAGTFTADATHTLVFSEPLNADSQTAVKNAVDAAYSKTGTATVFSAWNAAGTTLTVTITATDASNAVTLGSVADTVVTDLNANTSAALVLQQ